MHMDNSTYWISRLNLQPHPEGGYYKEVFRSDREVKRNGSMQTNKAITSIYYLLQANDFSAFHRIASDELWYFHQGSPLFIHEIEPNGQYAAHELSGQPSGNLSIAIKAGSWFASALIPAKGFVLVSCAVAPGFEFSEFEIADQHQLTALYPQHASVISKFCRRTTSA